MRKHRAIIFLAVVALLVAVLAALASAGVVRRDQPVFTIIHTNDMHGYVQAETVTVGTRSYLGGGMANLTGMIDAWRASNPRRTLVLDAGDIWQGTFVSNQSEGRLMIDIMNIAGYTAAAPGNHDFDFGQETLAARAAQASFPFLAANIVDARSGQTLPWLKPYVIKDVDGVRFGVIGLGYPGTPAISKPANVAGLRFQPGADAVRRYLPEVRAQSDIVVVLSHMGMADDEKLAAEVSGIDVIVGGHTHTVQNNPRLVGQTVIVQAGSNTKYLGRLNLTYDRATRQITAYTVLNEITPVRSGGVKPNLAVARLVTQAADQAQDILARPLGETLATLENCYSGECALGNLVTDAMRVASQPGDRPADVAMHNSGGLRATLPKGAITYGALFNVLPFGNVLTAVDLSGAQVLAILEKSVSGRPGNMHVSGMAFTFDMTRPAGSRVTSAAVGGQPLDPARIYRVMTIDYLLTGGDGQTTFTLGANVVYGDPCIDVVASYIKAHTPVNPRVEGRIRGS